MKRKEYDEREGRMIEAGKPDWRFFPSVGWPPPDGKESMNQGIQKTFAGDGELTEHMTATYWG